MAMMNVSAYYSSPGGAAAGHVFPPPLPGAQSDRLYGSPTSAGQAVHEVDTLKFDLPPCRTAGYTSPHGTFDTLHGYQGELHQQHGHGLAGYASYPARFNYAQCGGGGAQQPPPSTYPTRYLHDANKFDTGSDVITQYGGRHFGTAAMMAAAAVASIGGQHGPTTCPTLPIYPWMRSIGTGIHIHMHAIHITAVITTSIKPIKLSCM